MEKTVTKYIEKVKIFNHYTNYKGRLFVKTLCDLFNDVAEKQTEEYGVDVETLNAKGLTWMLHRLHISLHKMPHKEEEVYIETWPSGADRLFALRDYRMVRENGEELVRATSEWMYIDMNRRRPLRLPEHVVAMSTGHRIEKLRLPSILDEKEDGGEVTGQREFSATFDNIDFNGHVTQASYMRWITNSLPFEFLKKHILVEVEVIYAHEIMPDSFICSEYCMSESEGVVTILHQVKNEAGNLNHCIAKTVWESSSVTACTNI
jgi:acyl-ACP thioesterase